MKWTRRVSAKDSTRGRRQVSLQVEPLEGRALLATTAGQVQIAEYYQAFLHRNVDNDPSGLAYWTAQLSTTGTTGTGTSGTTGTGTGTSGTTGTGTTGGLSPNTVGLLIADSNESATDFVTAQYQRFLNRAPEQAGLTFWLGQLQSGRTPDQVVAGILGSQEFFKNAGSTNQGFLNALYADVLGRAPDSSGNTFWLNELARGVSRTTVANGFVTSTEASSDFVTTYGYQGILGRDPDSSGLSFWTTVLTGPTPSQTQQQVLVQFVVSSENTGRINTAIAAAPTETPGQIAQTLLNDTTFPLS